MKKKINWKGKFIRYATLKLILKKTPPFLKDSNISLFPIFTKFCKRIFIYDGKKYFNISLDRKKINLKLNLFVISKKLGFLIHKKK